jgi:DNA-binding PadR family transcriptional regulator
MTGNTWPTPTETIVMRLLQDTPRGAYGLDLVERSNGTVKRGSVYVLLGRLQEKGFVRVLPKRPEPDYPGPPRPRYQLTAEGAQVISVAEAVGMALAGA